MTTIDHKELVFLDHIRLVLNSSPNSVLFDIGGNRGEYTDLFLLNVPTAKSYIFEPIFYNFEYLFDKYKNNHQIELNIEGLSKNEGYKKFYIVGDRNILDGMSSLFFRPNVFTNIDYQTTTIQTTTVDAYAKLNNIDHINMMKIDTEGSEFDIILGSGSLLETKNIDFIQFEYGKTWEDANCKIGECVEFLNFFGYKVFEYTDHFIEILPRKDDYNVRKYDNFLVTHLTGVLE